MISHSRHCARLFDIDNYDTPGLPDGFFVFTGCLDSLCGRIGTIECPCNSCDAVIINPWRLRRDYWLRRGVLDDVHQFPNGQIDDARVWRDSHN